MVLYWIIYSIIFFFTILPLFKNQHWLFRIGDFIKIHILVICIVNCIIGITIEPQIKLVYQLFLLGITAYHALTIIKYTPLYRLPKKIKSKDSSNNITILSANVYQDNKNFDKFQDLILKYNPDIFITLESNSDWELANRKLEEKYPNFHKVTLENTYGMHLYTKLHVKHIEEHYFVANDIPCIEAHIKLKDGYQFVVFAVHPPPPSPTEEENSKERDGELLSIAKRIIEIDLPVVAIGDLNNVAWARSSQLFKKKGNLIDPRIGRGLIATFHAKYKLLRIPIDHIFHTSQIFVEDVKALEAFGSDHFPIWAEFWIDHKNDVQEEEIETTSKEEDKEISNLIREGVNHQSENRK